MSKRNLLNLILLVFILVLVVFVIYQPGKDVPATPPTLTDLKVSDIHFIKINRHKSNSIEQEMEFKKTAAGWLMLKPYQQAANSFRIDSILKLLSSVSLSQNSLTKLDPAKFGLKQPLATITFNETAIAFGHNKSLKNHRYVRIGSTLHMIADTFFYQLNAKAASFINHKLIADKSKITSLTLPTLKLIHHVGKWELTPNSNKFSADSINQLISEWQLSQAYDIEITKPAAKATANIILGLSDGKNIRFKSRVSKDNFTLTNIDSGIRYILSADRKNKLLKLSSIEQDD